MKILMVTNTYTPHVGGVARSVETFTELLRQKGHKVMVLAPEFEGSKNQADTIRVPAIQKFNGSDFSVRIPVPGYVESKLKEFSPELVHSHHPFLLGSTAVRIASSRDIPLLFTHHTMYERYTHYVSSSSSNMQEFVKQLSTGFANMCDTVIAPSQSVKKIIKKRGVKVPIITVPTGIDTEKFKNGDPRSCRKKFDIPQDHFLIGHLGRLAPEKNIGFAARAVAQYMKENENSHFLVAGKGSCEKEINDVFSRQGLSERLRMAGILKGSNLVDAYSAMDLFIFASTSETQGMVVAEAMAAACPVAAIDSPGVREVVKNKKNGFLLKNPDISEFTKAIDNFASLDDSKKTKMKNQALKTASDFEHQKCADKLVEIYQKLLKTSHFHQARDENLWKSAADRLKAEWEMIQNLTSAATSFITNNNGKQTKDSD